MKMSGRCDRGGPAFSYQALSPASLRVSALKFRNDLGAQQNNDRDRL